MQGKCIICTGYRKCKEFGIGMQIVGISREWYVTLRATLLDAYLMLAK